MTNKPDINVSVLDQHHYPISPFNLKVEMIRQELVHTIDGLERELKNPKVTANFPNPQGVREVMIEHSIELTQSVLSMVDDIGERELVIAVPKEDLK